MPICIGASWRAIDKRVPEYMAAFLLMEALMIGVFTAQDLFLFYIFFEGGLIPMYLIIGIWGGAERIKASYKFFLYTLLGSVLMLIAMLWMVNEAGTTSIPELMAYDFPPDAQTWLWLAFFASFAVKMPMWPVHTWLPDAHVQAPTAGSVILAGVLLKMGGYGFIRFSLPMFPEASASSSRSSMCCPASRWSSPRWIALVQNDMKKLIAYSSVAHMAFVTFGLFAFNRQGIEGAMIVMLSHGLVSGALFLCVGVIYDRLHTREIERYGGLSDNMPGYALLFMVFTMASVGLPGTSGFVGEFLSLVGTYRCRAGRRSSRPPASSSARPICSTSTGGFATGARTPTPPRCPTSAARMVAARRRSPRRYSGWASIRRASCADPRRRRPPAGAGRARHAAGRRASRRRQARRHKLMRKRIDEPRSHPSRADPDGRRDRADDGRGLPRPARQRADQLGVGCAADRRAPPGADRRAAAQRRAAVRRAHRRLLRRARQADHLIFARRWRSSWRTAGSSATSSMAPNIRC